MASDTKTKEKAPAADAAKPKGGPRPSAVIAIDISKAVDTDALEVATVRRTQWTAVLDEVYELTAAGEIPRNEDESLKFVPIGHYSNGQGAKAQVKSFEKQGLNKTYEFRVSGVDLYVRVIETPDA